MIYHLCIFNDVLVYEDDKISNEEWVVCELGCMQGGHEYGCLGAGGRWRDSGRMEDGTTGKVSASSMPTRRRESCLDFEGFYRHSDFWHIWEEFKKTGKWNHVLGKKWYDEEREDGASETKMRKRPNSDPSSLWPWLSSLPVTVLK